MKPDCCEQQEHWFISVKVVIIEVMLHEDVVNDKDVNGMYLAIEDTQNVPMVVFRVIFLAGNIRVRELDV